LVSIGRRRIHSRYFGYVDINQHHIDLRGFRHDKIQLLLAIICGDARGIVAQIGLLVEYPLPQMDLCYGYCFRHAQCCEVIEDGSADLDHAGP